MEYINKYIPREYLALKINYCRQKLEELPKVRIQNHNVAGKTAKRIVMGTHRYNMDSSEGKKYYGIWLKRDKLERRLTFLMAVWNYYFIDPFPYECIPHTAHRKLTVSYDKSVVMNRDFFDSLKNDANTKYPKFGNYYFDGIYYRSASERDIAVFYTENGIPFKYEPEITLVGLTKTINPDFVIYIEELDTCIFHEHIGIKNSTDYLRNTRIKYCNYTEAGLLPEIDIIFTYDTEDLPFDMRILPAKLNTAIYGLNVCTKHVINENTQWSDNLGKSIP